MDKSPTLEAIKKAQFPRRISGFLENRHSESFSGNAGPGGAAYLVPTRYDWDMKAIANNRRAAKKKPSGPTVSEYLSRLPDPARGTLEKIRARIRSSVPREAEEVISYGIPAFKHRKVIVWYAAFSDHCSLFPTAGLIERLKEDLKGYTISKGTIQFPLNQPLPAALLKKIVKMRLAQIG